MNGKQRVWVLTNKPKTEQNRTKPKKEEQPKNKKTKISSIGWQRSLSQLLATKRVCDASALQRRCHGNKGLLSPRQKKFCFVYQIVHNIYNSCESCEIDWTFWIKWHLIYHHHIQNVSQLHNFPNWSKDLRLLGTGGMGYAKIEIFLWMPLNKPITYRIECSI